eukprot:TRINITY_DN23809_c0_g1_i2.p1 TRINITY_DN23809_c0_g1~~TRINITY_DN23809_c0_g1_i2.p1  ORF type:complete len:745 (-),score=137.97 TRINITY_DN23809_c0_g1_i2:185-2365(-)
MASSPAKSESGTNLTQALVEVADGDASATTRTLTSATTITVASTAGVPNVSAGKPPPGHFHCTKCHWNKPLAEMGCRPNVCQLDCNSYKSLTSRWGKQRRLKTWWESISVEAQTEWYRKKQEDPPGTKRCFEACTYEEKSGDSVVDKERETEHFETYDLFFDRWKLRGQPDVWIEQKWKEEVEAPDSEAIWRRNQWLLPRFTGVYRYTDQNHTEQLEISRRANVASSEQLRALHSGGQELLRQYREGLQPSKIRKTDSPFVDANVCDQPSRPTPVPAIANQVHREANNLVRQEALRVQSENDDLLAATMATGGADDGKRKGKEQSATLLCVRLTGDVKVVKQKLEDHVKSSKEAFESLQNDSEALPEDLQQSGKASVQEVELKLSELTTKVAHATTQISQTMDQIGLATDTSAMNALKRKVDQLYRDLAKEVITPFGVKVRNTKKTLESSMRQFRSAQQASPAVAAPSPPHPLIPILIRVDADVQDELSTSVFEAKGGHRMAVLEPAQSDLKTKIETHAKVKKAAKAMTTHLLTHSSGVDPITDVSAEKKLFKVLKDNFDPGLFTKMIMPADTTWVSKVFPLQYYGFNPNVVYGNAAHMGLMEFRFCLEGEMIIFGVEYARIPGSTFKDKRSYLLQSNHKQIFDIGKARYSFHHRQVPGQLVVLPTGFFYIYAALEKGCTGIRWSLRGDGQCTNRTQLMLEEMLSSHPELSNPSQGYSQFKDWLTQ